MPVVQQNTNKITHGYVKIRPILKLHEAKCNLNAWKVKSQTFCNNLAFEDITWINDAGDLLIQYLEINCCPIYSYNGQEMAIDTHFPQQNLHNIYGTYFHTQVYSSLSIANFWFEHLNLTKAFLWQYIFAQSRYIFVWEAT